MSAVTICMMAVAQFSKRNLVAVLVAITAALFCRAWLQVELLSDGLPRDYAADLAYLVVPPILLALLFPVLRSHRRFIARLFPRRDLTLELVLNAFAIGFLLRLAAWCYLFAGVSFGLYVNDDPTAITGPIFAFDCAAPHVVALGFLVMSVMVPIIEEVLHRGLIQSWLSYRGRVFAILSSAFLFMLVHNPSSWLFAFFAGIVLGLQFWNTKQLWSSVVTHATVNGLIQVDWRCFHGHWNPPASQVPVWSVGIVCASVFATAVGLIIYLLKQKSAGVPNAPRQ